MKYKVGDRVRCRQYPTNWSDVNRHLGEEGVVESVDEQGSGVKVKWIRDEERSTFSLINENLGDIKLITTKEKKMSVVTKLKKLGLSKEERLLRKYDVHNDQGELTEEGKEVLWSIIEETHKDELVKKITELDKEEKKCKKGCDCEKCK